MTPDLIHAIEQASSVAATAFVSGVWQGIVLAAAAWLCLRLLPKTTAAIRFLVWSAVFLALALLPLLHMLAPKSEAVLARQTALTHAVHVDIRWSYLIAALWLAISATRAIKLIASAIQLRRIWKRAAPVTTGILADAISAADLRGAQLCTSADVDSPSVIGFFSPRVLIPEDLFGQLTAVELEQIVLHEIGHLRRADDWINLAQKIGLVLFPLNPALVWIEKRLCFERELACDDDVLRLTRAPKAYATCLTTLAERRLNRRVVALTLGAWERQSELSRRIYSILRRADGMSRTQARVVLGTLALALIGGSAELSRSPQLVSFARAASPVAAEAPALPAAAYQQVTFRVPTAAQKALPHETLLKASLPVRSQSLKAAAPMQTRERHQPSLQPVKRLRSSMQQWVVLTSWDGASGARMVMTIAHQQSFSPSYAAVPTAGGWLVFQL